MMGVRSMAAETGTRGGPAPSGCVASRHIGSHLPPATTTILIPVGSGSGDAQMVAGVLKPVLEVAGHASRSATRRPALPISILLRLEIALARRQCGSAAASQPA
jgi:hypothetical protein